MTCEKNCFCQCDNSCRTVIETTTHVELSESNVMTVEKIRQLSFMMKNKRPDPIADEIVFGSLAFDWFKKNMPAKYVTTCCAGESINSFSGLKVRESADINPCHIELRSKNGDILGITVLHLKTTKVNGAME